MKPVRRDRRKQGGNFLVELALSFLPYFAIIFGILDFSYVMFIYSNFQNAAREGCRFAITYSTTYNGTNYSSMTQAVTAVVQANTMGVLAGTNGANYIHVNYYLPDNLSTPATSGQLPHTLANGTVVSYLNSPGNVIEVKIQSFPWNWMVPLPGFMPAGPTLNASALDVLQGLPVGVTTPPSP